GRQLHGLRTGDHARVPTRIRSPAGARDSNVGNARTSRTANHTGACSRVMPLGTVSTVRVIQRSGPLPTCVIATGVSSDGSATYRLSTRIRPRQASQPSRRPPASATGMPGGSARSSAIASDRRCRTLTTTVSGETSSSQRWSRSWYAGTTYSSGSVQDGVRAQPGHRADQPVAGEDVEGGVHPVVVEVLHLDGCGVGVPEAQGAVARRVGGGQSALGEVRDQRAGPVTGGVQAVRGPRSG